MSGHFKEDPKLVRQRAEEEEEDDDIVTKAIRKTGCLQYHYDVQVKIDCLHAASLEQSVALIPRLFRSACLNTKTGEFANHK